ncbi:hypothetical protein JL720_11029 [Aureococcus anophagefferens]|nr:hypothetical protein JL720_11029 [Aureococcus anophagefferens]
MGLVVCSFLRSYVGWVRGSIVGLVALALCGQLVAFTVAHDASHNALSTNRLVNVLGCYGILCVTSPHEWTLQHVLGHHLSPNVAGEDPDVVHVDRYKARMLPAWLPKWCDVLLVWSVAVPVGLTTLAPLRVLLRGVYPGSSVPAGLDGKVVVHVLGRLLHLGAFFAWPFFSKDYSLAGAAAWVFAPAALGSLVFMAVTQIAHLLEETLGEQAPTATFYATQIANSCNFATDSAVVALLTGGLNQQVEHHAFPTVHHAHLPALAPIVKATCDAHGVPYHEAPSMTAGLAKHLDYLEALERRAKGGAPAKPSTLLVFEGTVAHARRRIASEPDHAFKVRRHAMWLLPLDDGDAMAPLTAGWLLSWRPGDHLRSLKRALASPADVADAVRELCARRGGETPGAVKLLCMPRYLGYTFNPIAVYYVYGAKSGDLSHVVFEVSNTPWLEETLYVHRVAPNGAYGPDAKQMHVSPFQPMGQAYDWLAPPPSAAKGLRLAVKVSRAGDRYFDATFDAEAKAPPASLAARLRAALGATPQVAVLLIHVHAAALLAKGARFYPHPSGVKTPFSRAVEVLFHGKLWLLLLSLAARAARRRGAALLLRRAGVDVTVFEASDAPGGHAMTVAVPRAGGDGTCDVDVGFQVFNTANYPRLTRLFAELGVDHVESDMSLSLGSAGGCWSSKHPFAGCFASGFSVATVVAVAKRAALLVEVLRFGRLAKAHAADAAADAAESTRAWLDRHGFSKRLADEFVRPMVGAIWSRCASGDVLSDFPAVGVFTFLGNHFMLQRSRPRWRTPRRRSADYVAKIVEAVGAERYELNRAVVGALAASSDAAVAPARDALSGLTTTANDVLVHRDAALMPADRGAWAAWNCRPDGVLTYWANALQPGVDDDDLFITLNPPAGAAGLWRKTLDHPVLDAAAAAARAALPGLQGRGGCYYAGAWCGYGFHEDGLKSAYDAVGALLGAAPAEERYDFATTPRLARWALDVVCAAARKLAAASSLPRPEIALDASAGFWNGATKLVNYALHKLKANTRAGSRENIAAHYDLSNDFFELWLDATMTYSSGLYADHAPYLRREGLLDDGGPPDDPADDASDAALEAAHLAKLDALIDKAGVADGDRVLEIGCGWGSLALRCCERFPNVDYVAITISKEQLAEARARVAKAPPSIAARARVKFCDYRDVAATFCETRAFDRVLSCEMIEAVGHEFLPGYFAAIHGALRGGGAAALQVITVPDARYEGYIRGSDFIRKHVFPGSSLVCVKAVEAALPKLGSLALRLDASKTESLGLSYARTLAAWRLRFEAKLDAVRGLGFDDAFVRKWRYYLEYCEAGFATKHIDVLQIRLDKTDESLAVEATEGAHGGTGKTLKDAAIKALKGAATKAFERGWLPDAVTRFGIRQLSAQQLRHCDDAGLAANRAAGFHEAGLAGAQAKLSETIRALVKAPVAVCTAEANEQHYEVDARFYALCLGPHRKYSACFYADAESTWPGNALQSRAAELLPRAEADSLAQFPGAVVVGVSNSHSQREYIMATAKARGLANLRVVTLDLSKEPLDRALDALVAAGGPPAFERASSIEMFEHMKNYGALFAKIARVLKDGVGTLFVHVFCHKQYAYHFVAKSDADWMAKYLFAGGTMPSADLFVHFAARKDSPFALQEHWRLSGVHYALTAEGWLQNMDRNADEVRKILAEACPPGETELWFHRWRAFYLACVELFGYDNGQGGASATTVRSAENSRAPSPPKPRRAPNTNFPCRCRVSTADDFDVRSPGPFGASTQRRRVRKY